MCDPLFWAAAGWEPPAHCSTQGSDPAAGDCRSHPHRASELREPWPCSRVNSCRKSPSLLHLMPTLCHCRRSARGSRAGEQLPAPCALPSSPLPTRAPPPRARHNAGHWKMKARALPRLGAPPLLTLHIPVPKPAWQPHSWTQTRCPTLPVLTFNPKYPFPGPKMTLNDPLAPALLIPSCPSHVPPAGWPGLSSLSPGNCCSLPCCKRWGSNSSSSHGGLRFSLQLIPAGSWGYFHPPVTAFSLLSSLQSHQRRSAPAPCSARQCPKACALLPRNSTAPAVQTLLNSLAPGTASALPARPALGQMLRADPARESPINTALSTW